MTARATLLLPTAALSECLFGAIVRDTRGLDLSDNDRANYFPASPLVTVTWVIEGETRMADDSGSIKRAMDARPLPKTTVTGPRTRPFVSWNPGPVFAISVGFYPDAWKQLVGAVSTPLLDQTLPGVPEDVSALLSADPSIPAKQIWAEFQNSLTPHWQAKRPRASQGNIRSRLSDWSRSLVLRSAMSGPGKTVRAMQRRLKRWTGQSRQSIDFFVQIEEMHALAIQQSVTNSAELALEAGYSDQSHMGRMVRKATGFSPVRLNRLVATEEAFWCYRLLGERF